MSDKAHILIHDLSDLGYQIRTRRKQMGISTVKMCQLTGLSRDTLHRMERGSDVNASTLLLVLGTLGLQMGFWEASQPTMEQAQDFYLKGLGPEY